MYFGKTGYTLPCKEVGQFSPEVVAAYTGPGSGLTALSLDHVRLDHPGKRLTIYPECSSTAIKRRQINAVTSPGKLIGEQLVLVNGHGDDHYNKHLYNKKDTSEIIRPAEDSAVDNDTVFSNNDTVKRNAKGSEQKSQNRFSGLELPADISSSILGSPEPKTPLEDPRDHFASAASDDDLPLESSITVSQGEHLLQQSKTGTEINYIDDSDTEEQLLGVYGVPVAAKKAPAFPAQQQDSHFTLKKWKDRKNLTLDLPLMNGSNGATGKLTYIFMMCDLY